MWDFFLRAQQTGAIVSFDAASSGNHDTYADQNTCCFDGVLCVNTNHS